MKRTMIIAVLMLIPALAPRAQDNKGSDFSVFTVNGVDIMGHHTIQGLISVFGEPDLADDSDFGPGLVYYFDDATPGPDGLMLARDIAFEVSVLNGQITVLYISSPEYVINDFVRVGDSIDKAKEMGGEWIDHDDNSVWLPETWSHVEPLCAPHFYYDEDGIITSVSVGCT